MESQIGAIPRAKSSDRLYLYNHIAKAPPNTPITRPAIPMYDVEEEGEVGDFVNNHPPPKNNQEIEDEDQQQEQQQQEREH